MRHPLTLGSWLGSWAWSVVASQRAQTVALAAGIATAGLSACASMGPERGSFAWVHGGETTAQRPGGFLAVRWAKRVASQELRPGGLISVERAAAALDPEHGRIYAGSSSGRLVAIRADGGIAYEYDTNERIAAGPALDADRDELYVVAEDGIVHALEAQTGKLRWKENAGVPVRQAPLLLEDSIVVVTDQDAIVSLARKDGALRWSFSHPVPDGFSVSGHAGIAFAEGMLYTGLTDGTVIALSADKGEGLWTYETVADTSAESMDPTLRLTDVDTTPAVDGDHLYAASYTSGLYAFDRKTGAVIWHNAEWTGIIGLAVYRRTLIATSADLGILAIDLESETPALHWKRRHGKGSAGQPVIVGDTVLVGYSDGPLVAISALTGEELARIESGTGFTAAPAVAAGLGFALSNGGNLYCFGVPTPPR